MREGVLVAGLRIFRVGFWGAFLLVWTYLDACGDGVMDWVLGGEGRGELDCEIVGREICVGDLKLG